MMPYLTEHFGNPHSSTHVFGSTSADAVERAREQVARRELPVAEIAQGAVLVLAVLIDIIYRRRTGAA